MISHRATESTEVELERINSISERVIGCAIEVHKQLGPGLLEHSEIHSLSLSLVLPFLDSYPFVHGVCSLRSLCLCG